SRRRWPAAWGCWPRTLRGRVVQDLGPHEVAALAAVVGNPAGNGDGGAAVGRRQRSVAARHLGAGVRLDEEVHARGPRSPAAVVGEAGGQGAAVVVAVLEGECVLDVNEVGRPGGGIRRVDIHLGGGDGDRSPVVAQLEVQLGDAATQVSGGAGV